ncbi:MAG TPA: hypothetical protein VKB02_05195, partial [Pyrinomonadaceae bacterium]|nr:hypothetical protein [Pyrinomonadaceae bacterium]
IKPGAQAPGSHYKEKPEPVKRATAESYSLSPAVAGSDPFYYYVNLGLAPQALYLRLLSQAKKHHSISTLCAKPVFCYSKDGFNCAFDEALSSVIASLAIQPARFAIRS